MTSPLIQADYTTSSAQKSHWLKTISPGLAFYLPMMGTVWRSSHQAKRGNYHDQEWVDSSCQIFRALEQAGVKFRVENLDVVKRLNEPCVFIGNHMSTLETFVLPCIVQPHQPMVFVVKKELTEYPFFRHINNSRNPIVVGRKNPKEDLQNMMSQSADRLQKGISVMIFPQTTRTPQFDPEQFNSIGVKIARRNNARVVPLALKTDAWGNGRFIKDFGKINPKKTVHFAFHEPVTVEGNGKDTQQLIVSFIQSKLAEWDGQT
jgi:1-acyl-sn-glycerol-3-phosphate acyltransferase